MDREKLIQRLMATFLAELDDHIASLNRNLLALEKEAAPEARAPLLQELFRTAHSLKGAARSVNVTLIEAACHRLEELLAQARDGALTLDRELFQLMFDAADAIHEVSGRLRSGQELAGAPLEQMLPSLVAAASRGAGARDRAESSLRFAAPRPPLVPMPMPMPSPDPRPMAQAPRAPADSGPRITANLPRDSSSSSILAGSLRVAAEKLDALLLRSGEILIASQRIEALREPVVALQQLVGRFQTELRAAPPHAARADASEKEEGALEDQLPRGAAASLASAAASAREIEKALMRIGGALTIDCRLLGQAVSALDEDIRRARMLPFAEACQGLARIARDLAKDSGKELDLTIEGGDVELDRAVLDGLKDALVHLVRNAVDHGIEVPAERRRAGKRSKANITIACALRGSEVEVVVADDGLGLRLDAIRRKAIEAGLPEPAGERDIMRLLFLPGFSTSPIVTELSGRGVGLDIVKARVEALHGSIDVSSEPARGARFAIRVPLTLTTIRALLTSANGSTFAIPSSAVRRLVRVDPEELRTIEGREVVLLGGAPVPVVSLASALGVSRTPPQARSGKLPIVVVASGHEEMAFAVDELIAEQEIVVKGLGRRLRRAPNISGATVLPSGNIALIVNAAELIGAALGLALSTKSLRSAFAASAAAPRKRLIVADDSVTTRILEKTVLEAAGYEVIAAADGAEAWRLLQERGADLVVTDVEMPRMDGFALTEAIRGSKRFRDLPVVLLTAMDSGIGKVRGIEVGADAYLVKSAFDQKSLLDVIEQLL